MKRRSKRPLGAEDLRAVALALPEATEGSHMGHPDFRVRNKIFASLHPDGRTAAFKAEPADLDALVLADPKTFKAVWGGRYLAVDLRSVALDALRSLAADSWRLVAPKSVVAAHADAGGRVPRKRPA